LLSSASGKTVVARALDWRVQAQTLLQLLQNERAD
jgi:hypothetical protein